MLFLSKEVLYMLTILNSVLHILGILGCLFACYLFLDSFRICCLNMKKLVRGDTKDSNDN